MKKQILLFAAAATLALGAAAESAGTPPPSAAQPQAYGNSGWTPEGALGPESPDASWRERRLRDRLDNRRDREIGRLEYGSRSRGDRDGDGVANRLDRFPDNPRRN